MKNRLKVAILIAMIFTLVFGSIAMANETPVEKLERLKAEQVYAKQILYGDEYLIERTLSAYYGFPLPANEIIKEIEQRQEKINELELKIRK